MTAKVHPRQASGSPDRERLAALAILGILDTPPEQEFDALVRIARRLLGCQIGLLSIIDKDRQWFKARCGLDATETPREHSFCTHAVEMDQMLVVPDATLDPRFSANPLVLDAPAIRFYAGVPVHATAGDTSAQPIAIGTLCVIDDKPRDLSADDEKVLRDLAKVAEGLLHARAYAVTAIKLAEQRQGLIDRLDREHRQFRQAERMANMGSWRLTLEDQYTEWSDQVYAIHELPAGQKPPLDTALDFYPAGERAAILSALSQTIETGQPFDIEADFITARGNKRRVRSMGELELQHGKPVAVIGVFRDITPQFQLEQKLRASALIDDLTQIANRAGVRQVLDEQIQAAQSSGHLLGLLLIDLDGFKAVNDRCGHAVGDNLLKLIATRLGAAYLAKCFTGRLGGDEFVVLLTDDADCEGWEHLVRRLLNDLRATVRHAEEVVNTSGTIGMAWLDDKVQGPSDLLRLADVALYEAKRAQRGTARVYGRSRTIHR